MAMPSLDLVCCVVKNLSQTSKLWPVNGSKSHSHMEELTFLRAFNICAILSSSMSILGAIYILSPKKSYMPRRRRSFRAVERQKKVLTWLSVADVLACVGVFTIAVIALVDVGSIQYYISKSSPLRWTCILTTAWIQYFYVATYFWTFFYALDVNMMLRGSNRKLFPFYLIIAWLLPAAMVIGGLAAMYQSSPADFECDPTSKRWENLLPHYLVSYVPMVIVLVVNPVMYWYSAKKVGPLLMRGNMFTDREREIQRQVQRKFFFIVFVFVLCWLPNVINGCILLNSLVRHKSSWLTFNTFTRIVWIAMAVMNPLQAFLNALIYWGPGGCTKNVATELEYEYRNYDYRQLSNNHASHASDDSGEESTPLIGRNNQMKNIFARK